MNDIKSLIADIVGNEGIFVEDVRMSETGGTIKVICDTEKGISSSELVKVTRKILHDTTFDEAYAGHYRLEVSSPGVDMPLTAPRHFRKNLDRDIDLEHTCKDWKSPIRGIIEHVDGDYLSLTVKIKKEMTTIRIPMSDVVSATVRLKW